MHHILFLRIRLRTARRPRPARLAAAAVVGVWLLAACSRATPTPTPVPTATPTATATFTPSVTPSPTATATPTFPADALVDVSTLNLRAGPNTLHPIVEVLGLGTPVAVTGRNDDASWLSVRSPAEGTGWINASFVRLRKDEARIPVVATPTSPPTPTATAVPMDPAQPLVLVPPAVALGDPVLVRLRAPGAAQVAAVLGDQQFTLFPCAPDSFAALFGIPPDSNPGEHAVHVTAVDGGGDPVPREVILTVHDARFEAEGIALDESRQRLLDPALKDAETARMGAEVWSVVSPEKRWAGIWTRPVTGTVSSVFGTRRSYNAGALDARHLGVDFRAGSGSPVLAPSRAHVLFAAPIEIGGNTVWLDHGWGVHSGYMHLRDIVVTPGTDVEAGQVLGTVGATGRVTGPHLHWEVRIHGIPVNPLAFLQRDVGQVP